MPLAWRWRGSYAADMGRNAIIFHGTGDAPGNCWYPWLAGQGRHMFDRLGGTQIVRDEGHFGDYDDPYPTFELLDRLID